MRVTNQILLQTARRDLGSLRAEYAKAQAGVHGRVLERPSDDPRRVVEAMDLAGIRERLQRAERAGQDARDWMRAGEVGLDNIIERLHAARDLAVMAGSPSTSDPVSREALALEIEAVRESLLREVNAEYRGQRLFGGWRTDTQPFGRDPQTGQVTYRGDEGAITRDVAPGLSVAINVTGAELMRGQDMFEALDQMVLHLRGGQSTLAATESLEKVGRALDHVINVRSGLGLRYQQVEQYEAFARDAQVRVENRLGEITGADVEQAVMQMQAAQMAYQTALMAFSKALPQSLLDHMR